ncbi:MAG: hypothetical protein PVF74_06080, partial [Anaerolineales bacterium]
RSSGWPSLPPTLTSYAPSPKRSTTSKIQHPPRQTRLATLPGVRPLSRWRVWLRKSVWPCSSTSSPISWRSSLALPARYRTYGTTC